MLIQMKEFDGPSIYLSNLQQQEVQSRLAKALNLVSEADMKSFFESLSAKPVLAIKSRL
jgi:hypothetical protein